MCTQAGEHKETTFFNVFVTVQCWKRLAQWAAMLIPYHAKFLQVLFMKIFNETFDTWHTHFSCSDCRSVDGQQPGSKLPNPQGTFSKEIHQMPWTHLLMALSTEIVPTEGCDEHYSSELLSSLSRGCVKAGSIWALYWYSAKFRRCKFPRIASFENFIKILSRINYTCMPHL